MNAHPEEVIPVAFPCLLGHDIHVQVIGYVISSILISFLSRTATAQHSQGILLSHHLKSYSNRDHVSSM